ncbi:lignin-forming anionic peroxidase [Phtheirospermum japonicum]|uniref:Ribosome-recycling factor, chloroplastic n=1 Tax=Phtheirospermum japonicum TaxID=374723 RepID=A0A830CAX6_9LAMI|nr:lignin-forming anionic peroxidase [Phtheirospermum japonicum]
MATTFSPASHIRSICYASNPPKTHLPEMTSLRSGLLQIQKTWVPGVPPRATLSFRMGVFKCATIEEIEAEKSMIEKAAKEKMEKTIESLRSGFNSIRTGRANPAVLDKIEVEYYGTPVSLKSIAQISTPDASSLLVQPYDKSSLKVIEKAIVSSDLGLTPNNDGEVIRLTLPQLTSDRRKELSKIVAKQAEEGKKVTDEYMKKIDTVYKQKEKAQLSSTFYDSTCPNALSTIRTSIRRAVSAERRMAASLIRLHFHDCFVQGCDASILLNDTPTFTGEQTAPPNANSARGYEVIEAAKGAVESICPGVVSCADVLSVAARDASVAVGGPSWTVNLGRRDSTTASRDLATNSLPRFTDPLDTLIRVFGDLDLSPRDLVKHNASRSETEYTTGATSMPISPPHVGGSVRPRVENDRLAPLDLVTPNSFDNNYFRNLVQRRGLLQSDQVLFSGGSTDSIVTEYVNNPATFASDFAAAMVRMGNIQPLTGQSGIIRRTCGAVN